MMHTRHAVALGQPLVCDRDTNHCEQLSRHTIRGSFTNSVCRTSSGNKSLSMYVCALRAISLTISLYVLFGSFSHVQHDEQQRQCQQLCNSTAEEVIAGSQGQPQHLIWRLVGAHPRDKKKLHRNKYRKYDMISYNINKLGRGGQTID